MSKGTNKIGIVIDPAYFDHDTGPGHPESVERLKAVQDGLDSISNTIAIGAREATRDELLMVHTPEYVDKILNMEITEIEMLDPDTAVSPGSKKAALKAVGGVLEAVKYVLDGSIGQAFCAVRPPGHHAEQDKAMGFCLFNNIAIGAAYALKLPDIERVAIIDWDIHHGNGTQNAFYDSKDVLYISLHQFPFYPGTGSSLETGEGAGKGYTVNIPMSPGLGVEDYRDAFDVTIMPALEDFKPGLILISAGFDAHRDDPLGQIDLTSLYYGEMTSILKEFARSHCKSRIVSVLEGGYNMQALRDSVKIHLKELGG
ncbi:MAG: histone deacetylase [candidate division Zixibacteria bacterium]